MRWFSRKRPRVGGGVPVVLSMGLFFCSTVAAQSTSGTEVADNVKASDTSARTDRVGDSAAPIVNTAVARYFDPLQGTSSSDLVRRALASNGELAAARLEIERARGRLRQAGLRPNPTLDIEQTTGRFTGARGESEISVGLAVPLELGGKRRRRIELAQAEFQAAEAEVADRERRLTNEVRAFYVEALASLRELGTLEDLNTLDLQTTRFVQARVNEGETAPIELNQLRVEVDRLRYFFIQTREPQIRTRAKGDVYSCLN